MAQQSEYRKPSGRPPMRLGSLMIRVALILLCLVMISIHLMSGMYARYTTKGSGGDDARVAKFNVVVTGVSADSIVVYSETEGDVYSIRVENRSEVAVSYDISVKFETSWKGVSAALDTVAGDHKENTTTFKNAGTLPVYSGADNYKEHTLSILVDWTKWSDADWEAFTKEAAGNTAMDTVAFTVTINVVQVD